MLLYYYERKGLLILLILISCLIILPRQLRLKKQKVFVLVPPTGQSLPGSPGPKSGPPGTEYGR